ncbi:dynamin-related protein 4C [Populus alba x Populus x berolinensis]|nr:dynamin-related protein 4C [Populus alba x Populus x berolinensis]
MGGRKSIGRRSDGKNGLNRSAYEEDSLPLVSSEENLLAIVGGDENQPTPIHSVPIMSSFNDRIRPILDAVDQLRHLMVMKEGIQLPTIVVVGDQSSGKSSVLESLAGISLPRGQGICTRVPLIMRLQHHTSLIPEMFLEFNGKTTRTDEVNVAADINIATEEIAGSGKGISDAPLTLVIKKNGVPDLTMVDLPGITRVPVHGQPDNIYEQIAGIVMQYIQPEESIILNVLPASVDFTTCESIRMSRQVDKTGERTLAVVTKADKAPEGLLEKVTADDVNIGLGYVCVRNRIGDESYDDARMEEANLFATHPLLSRIDKSIVGIPALAKKLMQVQAAIMAKCWPEIVRKINEKLNGNVTELNRMPKAMSSVAEFLTAFMEFIGSVKESLTKILVRGEYDEYPDDPNMHGVARVVEMFNKYSDELLDCPESTRNFLMDEIRVLDDAKAIALPNFLPRHAFLSLLQRKVERVSHIPFGFVEKAWAYFENVVLSVSTRHTENYPQVLLTTKRACQNLIVKMREQSTDWVSELVEMEKLTDYTCNPEYLKEWNMLMSHLQKNESSKMKIEGFGEVEIVNLRRYPLLSQAFDLKMRMTAYWKIVSKRLVDCMALHLQLCVRNLVRKELEKEIVTELMATNGGKLELMLEEAPSVAAKRKRLNASIELLREAKDVLSNIMGNVSA